MKAIAHRPQELRDIEGLLDVFPDANVARVSQFIREFAAAADLLDLPTEFEKLLEQRRPQSIPAPHARGIVAKRKARKAAKPK